MSRLAIKGHATRGKEIIEILGMLGGKNQNNVYSGKDTFHYYFIDNETGYIRTKLYTDDCWTKLTYIIFTLEEFLEKYPYKIGDKVIIKHKNQEAIVDKVVWCCDTITYWLKYNGFIEGNWRVEHLQPYKEEIMENKSNDNWAKWDLPDGYEFQDKDGNIINTSVIKLVKKQQQYPQQYPKTYKECCEILDLNTLDNDAQGYEADLIIRFQELLIARNAYWKIAGEQMGLGKPWEPDFTNDNEERYGIYTASNKVVKDFCGVGDVNVILTFPTEEMRDAFYENFKDLIEECKELL